MFEIGTKVVVLDRISELPEKGTIIFSEYDFDLDLYWIYIKSIEPNHNVNADYNFDSKYWCMVSSEDDNIFLDDEEE